MNTHTAPYLGLRPYEENDWPLFFGRDEDIAAIAAHVVTVPLTILYGPSGVGKSSLLRAGVHRRVVADDRFVWVYFRAWQSADPLGALKQEIAHRVERITVSVDKRLDELLSDIETQLPLSVAVVLDQFEDWLREYPNRDERMGNQCESELARVVNRPDLRSSVIIALRDDRLAEMDRFDPRIPGLFDHTVRLRNLSRRSAEDAIRKPVKRYNRDHEPVKIDDELIHEVLGGESEIEPVILQVIMTRVWNAELAQGSRRLRAETVHSIGGRDSIIEEHVRDVMSELSAIELDRCIPLLGRLVPPSETRLALRSHDLVQYCMEADSGTTEADVHNLLRRLERLAILRRHSPPESYEVFHDSLCKPLAKWRDKRRTVQNLEEEHKDAEAEVVQRKDLEINGVAVKYQEEIDQIRKDLDVALARADATTADALAEIAASDVSHDPILSGLLALHAVSLSRTSQATLALFLVAVALGEQHVVGQKPEGNNKMEWKIEENALKIWRQARLRGDETDQTYELWRELTVGDHVLGAMFGASGHRIAVAFQGGSIRVFDIEKVRQISEIQGTVAQIGLFALSDSALERRVRLAIARRMKIHSEVQVGYESSTPEFYEGTGAESDVEAGDL